MKPYIRQVPIVLAAALVGGGAAVAIGSTMTSDSVTTIQAAAPIPAANVSSETANGISPAAIYQNDAPGVVLITATSTQTQSDPADPFAPNQSQKSVAIGSGFVADAVGPCLHQCPRRARRVVGEGDVQDEQQRARRHV